MDIIKQQPSTNKPDYAPPSYTLEQDGDSIPVIDVPSTLSSHFQSNDDNDDETLMSINYIFLLQQSFGALLMDSVS
eukprot:Pgem_evm1s11863